MALRARPWSSGTYSSPAAGMRPSQEMASSADGHKHGACRYYFKARSGLWKLHVGFTEEGGALHAGGLI